jgi:hypothetical protein
MSTILLGTIDSHGTGGPFLAQAKAKSRMNKNRMTVLVFIVSTIRLSLGLEVLLAERFAARSKGPLCLRTAPSGLEERYALWSKGLTVTMHQGSLLLTNHSSYASQLTIPRGKLEALDDFTSSLETKGRSSRGYEPPLL